MRDAGVDRIWNVSAAQVFLTRAVTGLAAFAAFWILARIVHVIIRRLNRHLPGNADLVELLGQVAEVALILFGAVTALGTVGLNVSALVAGLGLTGFALGFAFRDILSNLLAGVLILLYNPFSRGDHISVSGLEGTVTHIDLRYTNLEHDSKLILIPNSNLFTNPIIVSRAGSIPALTSHTGRASSESPAGRSHPD